MLAAIRSVTTATEIRAENYSSWPCRDVLESMAASDLDARPVVYAPGSAPKERSAIERPQFVATCPATRPPGAGIALANSTSLATHIPSFCKLQRSDDWRGENTAGLSEESTCLRVTSTRSLSRSAKPRDRCGRTNKLLTIRSGLSQPSFATLPLARGSIPRSLSIVRGSEVLALECAVTLIVLITIGFLACGFLLHVLVQWMRDGSRKSAGSPSTTEVTHADSQKRQRLVIAFRRNEKRKSQRVSKPTGAYRGTRQKAAWCFRAPRENRTGAAFGMTGMRRTKWST
jgi:hypothetical protein